MGRKLAETPKIGLRATGGKRTLRFGLVNVGISMAPATDDSIRASARLLDPASRRPVKQVYVNESGKIVGTASDCIKGYAYGDDFVTLLDSDLPQAASTDVIDLVANVPTEDVPVEWIDKTYLAWPQDETHNPAYGLLATFVQEHDRALIGTTVLRGSTKVFAVRWSDVYGCLVAQLLTYHARVRWLNVDMVRNGVAEIPQPDPELTKVAEQMFATMPTAFEWESIADDYAEQLAATIEAKVKGGAVPAPAVAPPTAIPDLMASLQASIDKSATEREMKKGKKTAGVSH